MEMPPLKTLLFLITFLAVFGILVMTIPIGFLTVTDEYTQQNIPTEEFHVRDLEAYASTLLIPMNETGGKDYILLGYETNMYYVSVTIGGHKCAFIYTKANQTEHTIFFYHSYTVWWIIPTWHRMVWVNKINIDRGDYLTATELESDYPDYLPYDLSCSHFRLDATGLNAWDLIGMILFFKLPNVHPILNYVIAVPIWASIVWLATSLIIAFLKALPLT